jgi:small-conductance mechanosensitive channel
MVAWITRFYADEPLLSFFVVSALALATGFLVQAVGLRILKRIVRHFTITSSLVRSTSKPMVMVMPLLFLQLAITAMPDDLAAIGRVRHTVGLLLIGALTWLVVRSISGVGYTIQELSPISKADNLRARAIQTQARMMTRMLMGLALLIGISLMLMTFPEIRSLGASLLASAGLAGIVAGLAAKPVLGNLIAGLQIAVSQPIRIDDVLIVEGEWGRVEEITGAYVVMNLWDQRRLVIPLQWFIEHPFQNWTRRTSEIIGSVFFWVDFRMPLAPLRRQVERICAEAAEWDRRLSLLQVTDTSERAMQLRVLVSATDSSRCWDLRCKVREGLIQFMQSRYPEFLPNTRLQSAAEGFAFTMRGERQSTRPKDAGTASVTVGPAGGMPQEYEETSGDANNRP